MKRYRKKVEGRKKEGKVISNDKGVLEGGEI